MLLGTLASLVPLPILSVSLRIPLDSTRVLLSRLVSAGLTLPASAAIAASLLLWLERLVRRVTLVGVLPVTAAVVRLPVTAIAGLVGLLTRLPLSIAVTVCSVPVRSWRWCVSRRVGEHGNWRRIGGDAGDRLRRSGSVASPNGSFRVDVRTTVACA